ncbi:hypothetical protein FisN_24Hh058 [Fistulifera solaris]|uniref:Uncharacterized protein n=1 Tax=Fistulifera solaris TaxID=1519565 RepID=A0A1Z5JEQ4_FISSO|nr:hypothetical protein FisN_24Hh058 [Fistulifera solaris]|eukprot:GAX12483.1 hypothetical protein FisN_24Hh058 [Fistulifera solaris]
MTIRRSLFALLGMTCLSYGFITQDGNGFKVTSDVTETMNLALDIKAMRLAGNDFAAKMDIYVNGTNGSDLTLQILSKGASRRWPDSPFYNIYRHEFTVLGQKQEHDTLGDFDGAPAEEYADRLVLDLFELKVEHIEAEATVILHVMMAYLSELFDMVQTCYAVADGTSSNINDDTNKMLLLLDQAAALYVGAEQTRGESTGFLLYNLAQVTGAFFGQDTDGVEVKINRLVIELLHSLQSKISSGTCASMEGYVVIREEVKLLVKYTNTILVQMMLHHIQEDTETKADFVELYALALMPQIAICDDAAHDILLNSVVGEGLNDSNQATVISTLQSVYDCLNINCELVGDYQGDRLSACSDTVTSFPALVSYQPTKDVRSKSYIDRDIRQMSIFMAYGDFKTAYDWYRFGWNSNVKLRDFALNAKGDSVDLYMEYFTDERYYPDNLLRNAFQQSAPFQMASDKQRESLIKGTISGILMFWAVVDSLNQAGQNCDAGNVDAATEYWDTAAAYFVGSAEGQAQMGEDGGQLLFGVAKDMCTGFETCEPDIGSTLNAAVMASFKTGQSMLTEGTTNCFGVKDLSGDMVIEITKILVQATLWHAARVSEGLQMAQGSLLAYSRSLLPGVEAANPTAAATIDSNTNYFFEASTTTDMPAVVNAFSQSFSQMEINCADIGDITVKGQKGGVCVGDQFLSTPTMAPNPAPSVSAPQTPPAEYPVDSPVDDDSPTRAPNLPESRVPIYIPDAHEGGLAWGRYIFSDETIAQSDSLFTLDIRDMHDAPTPLDALLVYNQTSRNSDGLSLTGNSSISSLKEFSTEASTFMSQDPMYNFYRIALYEDEAFDDIVNAAGWPFGNAVVELALAPKNGNDPVLASKAAVVMNIWMMIVHRLYESARQCRANSWSPKWIDSAVALWIGQQQGEGKYNSGWSMYRVAQDAAMFYGNSEGEAISNGEVLTLLIALQQEGTKCDGSSESYLSYKFLVDETIRVMSTPLLQNLLYHMSEDNFEYVELYALAFIPQALSCNEGWYFNLRDSLYEKFERNTRINEPFIEIFSDVLICLKMECSDLGNISTAGAFLKDLVTGLCGRLESAATDKVLAGYAITSSYGELERIDLDIHQIELFMRTSSYDLASDVYVNGRNMIITGARDLHSLKDFTDSIASMNTGGLFQKFKSYSNADSDSFITDQALSLLDGGDGTRYDGASRRQLSEAMLRHSQTTVALLLFVGKMYEAVGKCEEAGGQQQVDEAAAFFIGSMEGRRTGGDITKHGKLMYALANEMCSSFEECTNNEEAKSNEFILFALNDLKQAITEGKCEQAKSKLEESIIPNLYISTIQGTLLFAEINSELPPQTNDSTLAAGDMLAKSILPVVANISSSSAAIISENMEFSLSNKPVKDGAEAVFDAFASVLNSTGIGCSQIGRLGVYSTCSVGDEGEQLDPETPTNLGKGLYVTTTYVQDRAEIGLDVKDMLDLLNTGDREDQALLVYQEGRHSDVYDSEGKRVDLRSLGGFSLSANTSNPLYTMAVYALRGPNGMYRDRDAWLYADTVVRESLSKSTIAAEAAVALNLWMELARELYSTFTLCKESKVTDEDGIHSIDEAVAYWIGDGQIAGESQKGHLLYALAEKMAENFGLDEAGQSRTNENILRLFHEAKLEVASPGACKDRAAIHRVRHVVNKILSQMIVLNIQALIHYLRVDDRDRVWVYAHGVVPLIAGCSPAAFEYLRKELLEDQYIASDVESIIQRIYSVFPCFGLQCDDIGKHSTETTSSCTDPPARTPLAGYKPYSDVSEESKIDLDILEMGIMMEMEAYEAAEDLYFYGKHVSSASDGGQTALSLQSLATLSDRSKAPELEAFKVYFGGDEKYADSIIASLFSSDSKYDKTERRVIATGVSQYLVMYAAILDSMYESIEKCESSETSDVDAAIHSWDKAAAYITGHLEGYDEDGSSEGLFLWGLASQSCEEFGTCSTETPGSAIVNDKISTILYSGRGAILGGNCAELRKARSQLIPLLQTPLIQASLSSLTKLNTRNGASDSLLHAEAHVRSLAILPSIAEKDRASADIISKNMGIDNTALVDGVPVVASAFAASISKLGIDCNNVGQSKTIDACTGDVKGMSTGAIIGIVLALIVPIIAGWFIIRRRGRKTSEELTAFVPPKGEFNHDSNADSEPEQPRSDSNGSKGNSESANYTISDDDDGVSTTEPDIV